MHPLVCLAQCSLFLDFLDFIRFLRVSLISYIFIDFLDFLDLLAFLDVCIRGSYEDFQRNLGSSEAVLGGLRKA